MNAPRRLLTFQLDGQSFGVALECVERVVRAAEVTPLPRAPEVVLGVINFQGRILPAVAPRRRFGLPERPVLLSDQFLLARTPRRTLAMLIDAVTGLREYAEQDRIAAVDIAAGTTQFAGALRLEDGLILIQDLERFFSIDEERSLDEALARA